MSSNDIYGPVKTGWSVEETKLLIESWNPSGNYDELVKLFPQFSLSKIKQKRKELKLPKTRSPQVKWTDDEVSLLRETWPSCYKSEDIAHLFPGKNADAIGRKACSLKLQRTDDIKKRYAEEKSQILRSVNQTILGTKHSYERSKYLASQCDSRQEFRRKHYQQYVYARQNGFLDEICEHMIVGDSFSYPQAFLFGCIQELFPTERVLYNDRKTIHPRELDVYLPDLKIAFEYDGAHFHQTDDCIKDKLCESLGIKLHRIREQCKINPERIIIKALESFGFDCSELNIQEITDVAFSKKISTASIIENVSSVSTMKEFKKKYNTLYTWLRRRNLLEKYCSDLEPFPKDVTRDEVLEFIKTKTLKKEVIGTKYYRALTKRFRSDVELVNTYNMLVGRLSMKL